MGGMRVSIAWRCEGVVLWTILALGAACLSAFLVYVTYSRVALTDVEGCTRERWTIDIRAISTITSSRTCESLHPDPNSRPLYLNPNLCNNILPLSLLDLFLSTPFSPVVVIIIPSTIFSLFVFLCTNIINRTSSNEYIFPTTAVWRVTKS